MLHSIGSARSASCRSDAAVLHAQGTRAAHLSGGGRPHPFAQEPLRAVLARFGRAAWQGTPLAARPIQVQNGIDHFAHVGGSWVSTWLGGRDERREDGPFLLGQIDFSN